VYVLAVCRSVSGCSCFAAGWQFRVSAYCKLRPSLFDCLATLVFASWCGYSSCGCGGQRAKTTVSVDNCLRTLIVMLHDE
jgi:hypothetical protein